VGGTYKKQAWAVRGASMHCCNGEVLFILGDDASGKSRLMTTLAEFMCVLLRRALTVNQMRRGIAVGGVDITKYDNRLLQKRMGLVLNDVRTLSDVSQVLFCRV